MHGDYLWRVNDHATTYRQIARHSRTDAEAYDEYGRAMVEMARFVKPIIEMTPADPLSMHPRDVAALAQMGRRFLQLAPGDRYNLAQLMTMSAIDFLDGWFETDVLKATMAASGIIGTFLGVRSPGTAYVLLHHYMGEIDGAFRSWGFARGGTGAISLAIAAAAREAGVEIRTNAPVAKVLVENGRATGVVLRNGDELRANVVSASTDPRLTFFGLVGEGHLPEDFVEHLRRYPLPRIFRQGEPRTGRAAGLHVPARPRGAPARRHVDLAEHRSHGARVRRREVRAVLEAPVHRHGHPDPHRSLGGPARQAHPVVLRAVRAVPPAGHDLGCGA